MQLDAEGRELAHDTDQVVGPVPACSLLDAPLHHARLERRHEAKPMCRACVHDRAPVEGNRKDGPPVIIGVLAQQVDPAGRRRADTWRRAEYLAKER